MKILLVTCNNGVRRAFDWVLGDRAGCKVMAFDDPNAALIALERQGNTLTHVVVDLDMPAPSVLAICYSAVRLAASIEVELVTIEGSLQEDGSRGVLEADAYWTISRSNMEQSIALHFGKSSRRGEKITSSEPQQVHPSDRSAQAEKFDVGDKIPVPGGPQFLARAAFDAHFAGMTKSKLFETRVLTLQVLNIEPVFTKTPPSEFRRLLGDICLALTAFFDDPSFRCTYNGNGVFLCALDAGIQFEESRLLAVLKTGDTACGTSAKLALRKLVYSVSQTKRAVGVFRSDDDLPYLNDMLEKKRVVSKPVSNIPMRPRRVQTRLLEL